MFHNLPPPTTSLLQQLVSIVSNSFVAMKPPPPENPITINDHLEDCLLLLTKLSDSIPSAQSFRGRWSAVSATLHRLRSALNEIAGIAASDLSHELLRLLSQTLTLILSLSNQCQSLNPPSGRLKTQSDLAAAATTLHQQAADAEFLISTGDLLNPLPRNSRVEALRSEARTLIARLQIGALASRIPALDSIISMMINGDDKAILIAVAQGLFPALLRLLDFATLSNSEARVKVISALSIVSSVETCRPLFVAEEALLISHLSRVLAETDGCGSFKEKACTTLRILTREKDIAMAVGSVATICILLDICRSGTPPAQAAAAGVLKDLSALPELRTSLVEENCIPILMGILRSGTVVAQENAASCLSNLIAGEGNQIQNIKLVIFQEVGLDCIKNYWVASAADNRDLEPAVRLLRNLSSSSDYFAGIILSAGFLPLVIQALDSAAARTRTEAAEVVSCLALASVKPDTERVECAVPGFVRMLEAKGVEEQEVALKVLASLMKIAACRRLLRKDEKGILSIIMLLDPLVCNVEKKYSVSILIAVAQTRRCRNFVVASGARGFLPRLQSMRVEGAEKLSELLSKGKLLGIFPRS